MRTSYSALDTFRTCPRKYKYQEIDRIKAGKRIEAVFGTLVHAALKFMYERSPLYPTLDEVVGFFTAKFNEKSDAIVWPNTERRAEAEKRYYEEGVKMLRNFYEKNKPWTANPVELETRFSVDIEDPDTGETHTIAGVIDRVDKDPLGETYEIIDYKTGKKMPSEEALRKNLQLSLYRLAIEKRWPSVPPERISTSLYYLKHNEKVTVGSMTPAERAEGLGGVLSDIREIEARKASDDFPPVPSPLCDWCPFKKICPMWSHEYKEKKNDVTEEELTRSIGEFFALKGESDHHKKRLAELRAVILAYMEREGVERVFGEPGSITKTIQERVSYDEDAVRPVLERLGLWEKVAELDEKKLESLLASLPADAQAEILALRTKRETILLKQGKKTAEI